MSAIRFLLVVTLLLAAVECKPFFDAIYDALNGNTRRSYGYSGYGNNGYGGYGNPYGNGYGSPQDGGYGYDNGGYGAYGGYKPRHEKPAPRQERTFKDICRVHFPASNDFPGRNGIVCPY